MASRGPRRGWSRWWWTPNAGESPRCAFARSSRLRRPPGRSRLLTDLDAAHRRGQEERTLNFAEAAVTVVEVVAGGRTHGEAAVRRSGLNARTLTPPVDPDEYAPEPNAAGVVEPRLAPAKPFDLTTAYSIEGWYGDAYQDLIPDRTETSIIIGDASDAIGAAHIAARLGLETTGMSLPITRRDDKVKEPGAEASPILVGRRNTLVQQLAEDREDPRRRPATGRGRSPRRAARIRQRHRDRRGGRRRGRHAGRQQLPGEAGSVPVGHGARRPDARGSRDGRVALPRRQERRRPGRTGGSGAEGRPRRTEGEDDRVVRREAVHREGRQGPRRAPGVPRQDRDRHGRRRHRRQPGRDRRRARLRGEGRHPVGGRRVLGQDPVRRPAEGEARRDGGGRGPAERAAPRSGTRSPRRCGPS